MSVIFIFFLIFIPMFIVLGDEDWFDDDAK